MRLERGSGRLWWNRMLRQKLQRLRIQRWTARMLQRELYYTLRLNLLRRWKLLYLLFVLQQLLLGQSLLRRRWRLHTLMLCQVLLDMALLLRRLLLHTLSQGLLNPIQMTLLGLLLLFFLVSESCLLLQELRQQDSSFIVFQIQLSLL